MSVKHTPGPWDAEEVPGEMHRDQWAIWAPPRGEPDGQEIVAVLGCDYSDPRRLAHETEANARLIAAAPLLADALDVLVRRRAMAGRPCSLTCVDNNCRYCAARSALRAAGRLP